MGPNLSTTRRVKYTCRCACNAGCKLSFGSDGVQTTFANKALTISRFLAFVSLWAPAACLLESPRCARLWTTSCPSRVLSPISCTVSNHLQKMVYRVRLQQQCRTPHCTRSELRLSVDWYRLSIDATQARSTPCTKWCAVSTSPLDLESYRAFPVTTVSSCLASFTAVNIACIAGSPSVTSTVLFRSQGFGHLRTILTGASAGPLSLTAASRSGSTTSMSSAPVIKPNSLCHDLSLLSLPVTFLPPAADHTEGTPLAKWETHQPVPLALSQRPRDWVASNLGCHCFCRDPKRLSICLSEQLSVATIFLLLWPWLWHWPHRSTG